MKRDKESLMSSGHERTVIDEDFMKEVGAEIRKSREQKFISLQEFSDLLDVNYSYVSQVERGERTPSFVMFIKFLLALDVRPDSVLWKVLKLDYGNIAPSLPFNQAFYKLNTDELDIVVTTVNALSEELLKKRKEAK